MTKSLVIFHSLSGSTKKIAEAIHGGISETGASCTIAPLNKTNPRDLGDYDLIGLGSLVLAFREPLNVRAIAKQAGMSSSSLHEHFKRATSLSPVQFVKRMRLHEARAQLLGGRGASEAAYAVGYSSPSQFSREFRRMFGHTPSQVGVESAAAP